MKEEIKDLFEKVNQLSRSNDDDHYDDDDEKKQQQPHDAANSMCLSKECIGISHRLFQNMDLNAKPCENFNQFACGNFIKEARIPDDKGRLTSFSPASDSGRN